MRLLAAFAGAFALAAGPITGISGRDVLTGKTVGLDAWSGRAVAINVWASWCEGCKKEAAALKAFERAHPGAVLGIDYDDSRAGARAFYARYDVEHPSIWDPKGKLVFRLKAIGLPTTVFLNRRHEVVFAIAGAGTRAQFENGWRRATGRAATRSVQRAAVPAPIVVTGFVTPSGNIICNAGPSSTKKNAPRLLSCTVLSEASPTKGQKLWSMFERGRVQTGYIIGDAATDLPKLRYGKTWRWRGFTCFSATNGLDCHNLAGHGFFLSRTKQQTH